MNTRPMGRSESGQPAGSRAASERGADDSSLPDAAGSGSSYNHQPPAYESENPAPADYAPVESASPAVESAMAEPDAAAPVVSGPRNFKGFLQYVTDSGANSSVSGLGKCSGEIENGNLVLTCANPFHESQLNGKECRSIVSRLAAEYYGSGTEVAVRICSKGKRKSRQQLRDEVESHPGVQRVIDSFGASIISVDPRKDV